MSVEGISHHYVGEIQALAIGSVHDDVRHMLATTYGEQFVHIPKDSVELEAQMKRGRDYLHSSERKFWHRFMGLGLAMAGMPASTMASVWISMCSGQEGMRNHEVLMFEQPPLVIPKVQTMRRGAHGERRTPFEHTTFIAHRERDAQDSRLLSVPGIHTIRKTGVDDLSQTGQVLKGVMDATGIRFFTPEELRGVRLLSQMSQKQFDQADIGPEMQWVYRNYPKILGFTRPRHAGIGMRASMGNGKEGFWKLVHHGIRQWTDLLFVLNATPKIELQMMQSFIRSRALKGFLQGIHRATH